MKNKEFKNNISRLDHIVIASPNLEKLASDFYELTGVKPVEGGRHEGKGTANKLIGLGEGSYLELIGPDLKQKDPEQERPLQVDDIKKTTVVGWSVRPKDMDNTINGARELGYDPGDPDSMDRKTPKEIFWLGG